MAQTMVQISEPACTGCDLCIPHCPFEALLPLENTPEHRKKRPVIVIESRCVGCLSCIGSCPTDALTEIRLPPDANASPLLNPSNNPPLEEIRRWGKGGVGVA